MAEVWNVNGLIKHLHNIPKDFNDFMDSLLSKCWRLRASKEIDNDKALDSLYDIQCGFHIFKNRSLGIAKVFNNFFEDIARCGPSCSDHLHYDAHRYLTRSEKDRLDAELSQSAAEAEEEYGVGSLAEDSIKRRGNEIQRGFAPIHLKEAALHGLLHGLEHYYGDTPFASKDVAGQ